MSKIIQLDKLIFWLLADSRSAKPHLMITVFLNILLSYSVNLQKVLAIIDKIRYAHQVEISCGMIQMQSNLKQTTAFVLRDGSVVVMIYDPNLCHGGSVTQLLLGQLSLTALYILCPLHV